MLSREGKQTDRGAVGAEFIGYNRRRREALLLQEFPHQPNCRPSVPAGLNQEIQDFALTVHGTPEIELPPSNYDDHLVQVPAFGRSWPPTLNPPRIGPTEFQDPSSNCLIRDVETTLGKQVLNVPIAQRETAIEPDGMLDDDRWKAVTTVGYLAHPETLKHRPCRSHAVNVTMPREEVLEAIDGRAEVEITLDTSRGEERTAREQVLGELAALGIDIAAMENDGLNVIIEQAAEEQRQQESAAARKVELTENVQAAAKEMARRERELQQANEALDGWRERWAAALGEVGLAKDTAPEAVSSQIDTIDQMRETAGRIRSLRHDRIDKINRDVTDFEQVVEKLAKELAKDLAEQPAEDAVLELEKRLADAERIQGLREKTTEEIEELTTQISGLEDERRELAASISHLKKAAGVETKEALKDAIERSDRQRSLTEEHQKVIGKLQQDGDGKSVMELEDECKDALIDEVAAEEISIQAELEDLQTQQTAVAEERSRAREAFQAIGGDDAAAKAAANKEEALAEMREVAERYVRVQTSAILLRWAIERYRREKQAPLLKRAGELFKVITEGSFASLQVAFDDQDIAYLTGVRPGGSIVPVSGMSSGTADQLYLALRVAAIEDYLDRADALPFVADDLFINFDDDRAAAGFRLLGELSQKTQVLFFTHHQHLVEIARKTLGASVSLVSLTDQEAAAV